MSTSITPTITRRTELRYDSAGDQRWTLFRDNVPLPAGVNVPVELARLRGQIRSEAQNNPILAAMLRVCRDNVVGAGIEMRPQAEMLDGSPDMEARAIINRRWERWQKSPKQADWSSRHTLTNLLRLVLNSWLVDGEGIVRRRLKGGVVCLDVIDAERIPTWFVGGDSDSGRGGSAYGLEFDKQGRITHWLVIPPSFGVGRTSWPYYSYMSAGSADRVPEKAIHRVWSEEAVDSIRGRPQCVPAIVQLHQLAGLNRAVVANADLGAKLHLIMGDSGDDPGLQTGGPTQAELEAEGPTAVAKKPGMIEIADKEGIVAVTSNSELRAFEASHPHAYYGALVTQHLSIIAAAFGVAPHHIGGLFSGINFSSGRLAETLARRNWSNMQLQLKGMLDFIWQSWLNAELLSGRLSPLTVADYDRLYPHDWRTDPWQSIEPSKDAASAVALVAAGIISLEEAGRRVGVDPLQMAEQIEAEREAAVDRAGAAQQNASDPPDANAADDGADDGNETEPNEEANGADDDGDAGNADE